LGEAIGIGGCAGRRAVVDALLVDAVGDDAPGEEEVVGGERDSEGAGDGELRGEESCIGREGVSVVCCAISLCRTVGRVRVRRKECLPDAILIRGLRMRL
jgi:hypothetical protein